MRSDVAIVILNYNLKAQTINCASSVSKSLCEPKMIVVVDNSDKDKLRESDFQKIPGVKLISTGQNLGYSGGNNVGIRFCLDRGVEFIFILNPDTTIDSSCIGNLVSGMASGVGIAGPKILFKDKKTIWYAGGIFDQKNVLGRHRGVDELDCGQYDNLEETDYVSGAALFVRSDVFRGVGLFDERYFLYYEDADLCFRAKQAGFKIVYVPQAVVYHHNAQSTKLGSELQDYYITRNRLLFAIKFLPIRVKLALLKSIIYKLNVMAKRKALFDVLTLSFGQGGYP